MDFLSCSWWLGFPSYASDVVVSGFLPYSRSWKAIICCKYYVELMCCLTAFDALNRHKYSGKRTLPFLPSFLSSFFPSFLPPFLPSCLPAFLPSFLPSFLPLFLPSYLPSFLRSFLPSRLPFFLPSFLPSSLPFFHPAFLPPSLFSFLPVGNSNRQYLSPKQ